MNSTNALSLPSTTLFMRESRVFLLERIRVDSELRCRCRRSCALCSHVKSFIENANGGRCYCSYSIASPTHTKFRVFRPASAPSATLKAYSICGCCRVVTVSSIPGSIPPRGCRACCVCLSGWFLCVAFRCSVCACVCACVYVVPELTVCVCVYFIVGVEERHKCVNVESPSSSRPDLKSGSNSRQLPVYWMLAHTHTDKQHTNIMHMNIYIG